MSSARRKPIAVLLEGDNTHLANLCGPLDENLKQIANGWNVKLNRRGNRVSIEGEQAEAAADALRMFHQRSVHKPLSVDDIQLGMVELAALEEEARDAKDDKGAGLPELPPL